MKDTALTYVFSYVSMKGSQHVQLFKDSSMERSDDDPHVGSKHVAHWNNRTQ